MKKNKPAVTCNYCGNKAELVRGFMLYPHREDLAFTPFYRCEPCDAQVGCHPNTIQPLGSLANKSLRNYRSAAHMAFDPIWKNKVKGMSRSQAYSWLAKKLGIPKQKCHIGMFDKKTCLEVTTLSHQKRGMTLSTLL